MRDNLLELAIIDELIAALIELVEDEAVTSSNVVEVDRGDYTIRGSNPLEHLTTQNSLVSVLEVDMTLFYDPQGPYDHWRPVLPALMPPSPT